MAGTVGAIFNGALQLGSAVGISAVSSIETSIEEKNGDPTGYKGRAAAFWFMLAISVAIFYRVDVEKPYNEGNNTEKEGDWKQSSASLDQELGITEEPVLGKDEEPDLDRDDTKHSQEKGLVEEVREEPVA
ncbi:hypothetical protein EIP86_007605 [Pleurotus ostreatoroseus]|nr:hypothetical protein EIP86_007605 [Pleurotus ostreatoroseus]